MLSVMIVAKPSIALRTLQGVGNPGHEHIAQLSMGAAAKQGVQAGLAADSVHSLLPPAHGTDVVDRMPPASRNLQPQSFGLWAGPDGTWEYAGKNPEGYLGVSQNLCWFATAPEMGVANQEASKFYWHRPGTAPAVYEVLDDAAFLNRWGIDAAYLGPHRIRGRFWEAKGGDITSAIPLKVQSAPLRPKAPAWTHPARPAEPPAGWMNPCMILLQADGDDIQCDARGNLPHPEKVPVFSAANLLACFLAPDAMLELIPLLPAHKGPLAAAMARLHELSRGIPGDGPLILDALFRLDEARAEDFLALDALRGRFIFHFHEGKYRVSWELPAESRSNQRWLAFYFASRLGIEVIPHGRWPLACHEAPAMGEGYRPLQMAPSPDLAAGTAAEVWRAWHPESGQGTGGFDGWVADLLEVAQAPARKAAPFIEIEKGGWRFDEWSFLDQFVDEHLRPESPLVAVLPAAWPGLEPGEAAWLTAQTGRAVHLIDSVAHGPASWLRELWRLANARQFERDREVVWELGWWREWLSALYWMPAGGTLRLTRRQAAFILGRSRLGLDRLGQGATSQGSGIWRLELSHPR